jgi:hypothetical protein
MSQGRNGRRAPPQYRLKTNAAQSWNGTHKILWNNLSSVKCMRSAILWQGKLLLLCNGKLFDDFGYTASTPASKAVLDGTYVVPTNSDTATMELFTKIAAIRKLIPKNSVSAVITPTQWRQYWKIVNEETSSSESGLHFGHYIVGGKSDLITHYHAARVSVT